MSLETSRGLGTSIARALRDAEALAEDWPDGAPRLLASVVRPLTDVLARTGSDPTGERVDGVPWEVRLRQLTDEVSRLAGGHGAPAELAEAAAALQDLDLRVLRSASGEDGMEAVNARMTELAALLGAAPGIRVEHNGPYLVTGGPRLTTHLGEPIETRPALALCRCGASESKPFCDGSHARTGFTDAKDPKRRPDRRDTYQGTSVTIFDNRGLCQHSGFCTDRLSSVFHSDSEPFVTPSGGRMDEIINAVRACPSGALSFAVDGREAREQVDRTDRPHAVEVSKDGPYRITGGLPLTDDGGHDVERPQGASLEHYALCRCGQSQNKPFCSGMHWYVGFEDPPLPEEPTVFQWAGGFPAFLRMTKLFYVKYVPQDPLLAPLFARMSPDHPERVASWLSEVFGGPEYYSRTYGGYSRMIGEHLGKCLTEEQRARWTTLMCQAANEVMLPNDAEFRAAFVSYLEWGTRLAVENSQSTAKPPLNMPMPHWWWTCDARPGSRVSALAPPAEDAPTVLPARDEAISFQAHVKTLFRQVDRNSMKFVFDLWSYEDVATHAEAILERVRNGSMPCDGKWPQEKINAFAQWVEAGKPQ